MTIKVPIQGIGEFGLIDRIKKIAARRDDVTGIGDDCAVVPLDDAAVQLLTTDLLIEDVHFLKSDALPADLGHKALAVNLSDIAAMGGKPLHALLSLGLPGDLAVSWVDQFVTAFEALARSTGTYLIGGDTTKSDKITISVTIIGTALKQQVKLRSGAKVGDILCVTGPLGTSKAGLDCILKNHEKTSDLVQTLRSAHYNVTPHLKQGAWLAQHASVHAMMDISDGMAGDIRHLMMQSNCGAEIALDALPKSPQLLEYARQYNADANEYAYKGGEDYCLLLTIAADQFDNIAQEYARIMPDPLFPIGRITKPEYGLQLTCHGKAASLNLHGYDHFL